VGGPVACRSPFRFAGTAGPLGARREAGAAGPPEGSANLLDKLHRVHGTGGNPHAFSGERGGKAACGMVSFSAGRLTGRTEAVIVSWR